MNTPWKKTDLMMYYKCGPDIYMGALDARLIGNVNADVSGEIEL